MELDVEQVATDASDKGLPIELKSVAIEEQDNMNEIHPVWLQS